MSIALVGVMGNLVQGSLGQVSPTFGQATSAGNLLIAWIAAGPSVTQAIATTSTGWAQAVQDNGNACAVFYKPNCSASEASPTFSVQSTVGFIAAYAAEFSGAATSSPVDRAASGSGSPLTTLGADVAAGELVCVARYISTTKSCTISGTEAINNGATTFGKNSYATKSTNFISAIWGVTTGNSAADNETFSLTSSTGSVASDLGALASFKLAAAAQQQLAGIAVVNFAVARASNY